MRVSPRHPKAGACVLGRRLAGASLPQWGGVGFGRQGARALPDARVAGSGAGPNAPMPANACALEGSSPGFLP
ncbi:MAG TPA: hypothetical protein VET87_16430 [Rubrivivax sp.]|nr:hypothetical protein [Rubrivivax sp.]